MANCMQLEIVTPDKLLFSSDEIVYLGLRTNDGGIGIEANHIPVIASLDIAPMNIVWPMAQKVMLRFVVVLWK